MGPLSRVTLSATPRETVYASDPTAAELEELTLTLGEGPGVDAVTDGPALVGDLTSARCAARWPAFAPAAVDAGARQCSRCRCASAGYASACMDLYRARPVRLIMINSPTHSCSPTPPCALLLDAARRASAPARREPERAGPQHPEVHQATGMITVQLGVTAAVALIRLRAYAYCHDRRLRDVAADVVARRLRFTPVRRRRRHEDDDDS